MTFTLIFISLVFHHVSFSQIHDHHHKEFKNPEQWSQEFDEPSREAWQKPQDLIRELNLSNKALVADLGAGTGYMAFRIAQKYPEATVYAIDSEKSMIDFLNKKSKEYSLKNVKTILATTTDFELPQPVDLFLVVNTYHHLPNRSLYFQKIKRWIKPDGQIVIVDFLPDSPTGPPKDYRYQPPQILQEMQPAGFEQARLLKWPRQFVLFLKKSSRPSN